MFSHTCCLCSQLGYIICTLASCNTCVSVSMAVCGTGPLCCLAGCPKRQINPFCRFAFCVTTVLYGGPQLTTFAQTTPTPQFMKKLYTTHHTTTFFIKCGVVVVSVWFGRRLSVVDHRSVATGFAIYWGNLLLVATVRTNTLSMMIFIWLISYSWSQENVCNDFEVYLQRINNTNSLAVK